MQTLNQLKSKIILKKSQSLLIGSLLIFFGFVILSWDYLLRLSDEVYSDMKISMMGGVNNNNSVVVTDSPENVNSLSTNNSVSNNNNYVIDYSQYLGVLEIPRIDLKRGFYNTDSKYNTIEKNVTMVSGSTLPDVPGGNLILIAHSGDAYISYFAYLYLLKVGDSAYVTYGGHKYHYKVVDIYEEAKTGIISVVRNTSKTTLTMITCTKDNDYTQTVYICELVE